MNYIGLDAHSKTCTFVVLDKVGQALRKATVETSEKYLLGFLSTIEDKKKLVFEESNLSQWLYIFLKDHVDELIVCNPRYLAARRGAKNDYQDAFHLANELRCNHITPVHHEDNHLMRLRTLYSSYSDIVRDCTRSKNRYKAILRSNGVKTKLGHLMPAAKAISSLTNDEDKFVVRSLFRQIELLEQEKAKYQELFLDYKKKHQVIKNLSTIPGISTLRASALSAYLCSPHRFQNKHKLWSYAMLVRHKVESGGKVYGSKIKYGRTELKNVFMGAALNCLIGDNSLRKYYDRLRSKGFDDKKARKAVARKIAAIVLHIMKSDGKYDDELVVKKVKN